MNKIENEAKEQNAKPTSGRYPYNVILKSCPFCGGEAVSQIRVSHWSDDTYRFELTVYCADCRIEKYRVFDLNGKSFSDFISASNVLVDEWNKRIENEEEKPDKE